MTRTEPDILFSPEGTVLADPSEIERALAALWKPASEEAPSRTIAKTATRISVANLIVVAPASEWDALLDTFAELSPLYPTRTITLLIDESSSAPSQITSSVSALCHVPQPGEPQVCAEQVVLRAGPQHVDILDETLLPVLESDVPVMAWWRSDPARWPGLFTAVRTLAARLIVDAGPAGFAQLVSTDRCAVRELGWYRTYPWRELIAGLFDGTCPEVPLSIKHLAIEVGGDRPEDHTDAVWLAAFMAGQLDWLPVESEIRNPKSETSWAFTRGTQPIRVLITRQAGRTGGLSALLIAGSQSSFEVRCCAHGGREFRLITCDRDVCQMPRTVHIPPMRRAHALASALAGRPMDPAFDRARPIAEWMMSR